MATTFPVENKNQNRTLRVQFENSTVVMVEGKDGKTRRTVSWKPVGPPLFVPPLGFLDVLVGDSRRAVISEQPS